ncbi:glycosyltransferase family 4 protein [Salicibibacter cibarius]|uniref:Glycosyltransferase family 4 protein n=1 Tax=Salicibibacter cibarius TaxID=2743000 RepID=A0A7T6Z4Y6_9BACI|nr:glycosyltransferase family 4 protein [Salicibibacter cibarius]QQK76966.1 glycosyltransferase family 4 protein [Salicibibacter cibarius]
MEHAMGKVRKILLVADHPGWAFHHRAKEMMALPSSHLQFDLKYRDQLTAKDNDQYDIIYAMSVLIAKSLHQKGIPVNKLAAGITSSRQFNRYKVNKDTYKKEFLDFFTNLRGVNTVSNEFVQQFNKYRPIYKTRTGINENLFKPSTDNTRQPTFTVGWVGRIDGHLHRKLKGYDIVLSAIKGLDMKLDIRTFTKNNVSRDKMVEFYQGLDCFICSSESEHIPLPVLEAGACGIPIISTQVGIVPEVIKSYENGIIIQRNASAIREALLYLMKNPGQRKSMGRSIRQTILDQWTWDVCWKEWEDFFTAI